MSRSGKDGMVGTAICVEDESIECDMNEVVLLKGLLPSHMSGEYSSKAWRLIPVHRGEGYLRGRRGMYSGGTKTMEGVWYFGIRLSDRRWGGFFT